MVQNALQQEWGNFPFANWNGICWGLLLQLVQLIKIHFLPHLESFMRERKFEKIFFKKSHLQTPNVVLLIFKLPFPNGSYRNGVCRALWAFSCHHFPEKNLGKFCQKVAEWVFWKPHIPVYICKKMWCIVQIKTKNIRLGNEDSLRFINFVKVG